MNNQNPFKNEEGTSERKPEPEDRSRKKRKGKKNCRCWICNEEGHYANECPNRKKHDEKARMLETVYSLGFLPIEEPYEDIQEVYILEEELDPGPESSEDDESNTSESD